MSPNIFQSILLSLLLRKSYPGRRAQIRIALLLLPMSQPSLSLTSTIGTRPRSSTSGKPPRSHPFNRALHRHTGRQALYGVKRRTLSRAHPAPRRRSNGRQHLAHPAQRLRFNGRLHLVYQSQQRRSGQIPSPRRPVARLPNVHQRLPGSRPAL